MVRSIGLPFDPLRHRLYSADDLFGDVSLEDPDSYAACADVLILSYFVRFGKNPTAETAASTVEALHDNSISLAIQVLLANHERVVAVMGGHKMVRGSAAYADVALFAWELTREGFLLASGGGPGAMEATHLGALFASRAVSDLRAAIEELQTHAKLPDSAPKLVEPDGSVNAKVARELHEWFAPALRIARAMRVDGKPSLAVPTWLYGYEPTTPFATDIGKYFQNSLREDGLVTLAKQGILYAEGKAGTVQEIFQDTAQNYYGDFLPMVFLSARGEDYWNSKMPVQPLIKALLGSKPDYEKRVLFTDDHERAVAFVRGM